jgi:hypothetical protein
MKKKLILISVMCVCLAVGFFAGSYFMFNRMTTSENYKRSVVKTTIADLQKVDVESLNDFDIGNYPNFCWGYDITLFNPSKLKKLQNDAGKNYGRYYSQIQKIEREWHHEQSMLIRECSSELVLAKANSNSN